MNFFLAQTIGAVLQLVVKGAIRTPNNAIGREYSR
jgi:hypothetical protein